MTRSKNGTTIAETAETINELSETPKKELETTSKDEILQHLTSLERMAKMGAARAAPQYIPDIEKWTAEIRALIKSK